MNIILSLYPNTRGLGYACIDMPQSLLDFGIVTVCPAKNERLTERIEKFMDFFKPKIILVRDSFKDEKKYKRINDLLQIIEKMAEEKDIPVHHYSRRQIRDAFEVWGATTKYEIAQQIIRFFKELTPHVPKIRKPWLPEDYNMGIFDAIALAVTHQHLAE